MAQIGVPLVGSYDYRLVVLSFLIAILASNVGLDLAVRVTAARGRVRHAWLAGGAISMGLGIWSMHFVGMQSFRLPISVLYDVPTVLLSLLPATLASAVALYVVSGEVFGRREALVGSLVMGCGIASTHYLGMAAMRLPATCHYNPLLLGLSILIAVVASLAALVLAFNFREEPRRTWAKGISAAAMGVAIASMHYTGMASASFETSNLTGNYSRAVSVSSLAITGIAIVTLMTLGFTLLMTFMGRQFAAQALQLQSSEQLVQQSRAVIDAIPQQIWSGPADGTLDFCNERWRSYMGLGLAELRGEGWQCMLHPDDRERVLKAWRESVTMGKPHEQEERHRRADGQYRWFLARGVPQRDADGRILRWYGTNTDIEDLKRAEDARRQIEEQHRIVVETATDSVVSMDEDSKMLFVNPATMRVFGYEPSELVGRPLTMLMPEFMRGLHKKGLQRYLATGHRHINWQGAELVGLRKNGDEFPVEVSFGEVRKEGRSIFTGYIRDITERKQADAAIREGRDRAQRYLDIVDVILLALDLEERITLINRKGCSTLGWEEQELLGRNWINTCLPVRTRDKLRTSFNNLLAGDFSYIESPVLTKSGDERMIGWRNTLLRDAEGRVIGTLNSGEDITERKKAEEDLRRLSGQLLRLQDEERRRIARDLHDSTGQDLVALATMLGQLRRSVPSVERKSRRLLSECKALADRCIREVRTLSYVLHPPVLDHAGLGIAIRDYVKGFIDRSGIQVELDLSPRLVRMTRDVELTLFRIVQESLTNIQRHSGSRRAEIRIHRDADITLEITDIGHGFAAIVQKGREEPGFEVGVGIPSMQERVNLIGGRLEIDSTSQGTTVRVTIPLRRERI